MILESLEVDREELRRQTGWEIKPEGACKAEVCIPVPSSPGPTIDARVLSERLRMPLVHDAAHGIWALGPGSGGQALTSADFPDLRLPDWHGDEFDFRSLRGQKIFLLAWASW